MAFVKNTLIVRVCAPPKGVFRAKETEMDRLGKEIEEMDAEIEDLTHNRDSIEAYAREAYKFAAPGDDVYIVE